MDISNLTPEQIQTILAAVSAQQATPATVAANVTPAAEPAPTVDIEVGDVLGRGGYGPSLFSKDDPIGTAFTATVAQPTRAEQLRDFITKEPKFFKDGSPIPQLIIGLDVPVSDRHPEGRATWFAKGRDIAATNKAMVDAGVPRDEIKKGLEVGATITVTYSHNQPSKFGNDAKIRTVQYTRPGQAAMAAPVAVPVAPVNNPVSPVNNPTAPVAKPTSPVAQAAAADGPVDVAALLAQLQGQQTA